MWLSLFPYSILCSIPGSVLHSAPIFYVLAYLEAFLLIVLGHLVLLLLYEEAIALERIDESLRLKLPEM